MVSLSRTETAALDKATRNTLRLAVTQCRRALEEAVAEQLEGQFGIHRDGTVEPAARMTHLDAADRAYREQLARYLAHLEARGFAPDDAVAQLVREIAFTHLNRLCAYKLLERRRLIRETVSRGLGSNGFKFYVAEHPDDETLWSSGRQDLAYRHFLEWTGRTLGAEMPALFSEDDPANRLFPPQRVLDDVLARLNDPDLAGIWDSDETIGWIYQYFTPKELRDEARKASQAPRNSYELAFRNQFYTPRYVVEFLVDNTLGRLWWEMRRGQTALADRCASMLRKPHSLWLRPGQPEPVPFDPSRASGAVPGGIGRIWMRPNPALSQRRDDDDDEGHWMRHWEHIAKYALTTDGYLWAMRVLAPDAPEQAAPDAVAVQQFYDRKLEDFLRTGIFSGDFEELRLCLFAMQRAARWTETDPPPAVALSLHRALCDAWDREAELVAYRKKRDPRELRVLDPACGSGHFLLYAFDLLVTIYQEAWDDPDLGPALRREFEGNADRYRAAIPGLILRHNLHGVDIDLRATQIAALALWLRAQREYAALGLARDARPPIRRANIVYAEPMPGERELRRELVETLDPPALIPLFEEVWAQMKLAGEAGSLLQVERALRDAIARAKREWIRTGGNVQLTMFEQAKPPTQQVLSYTGVSDVAFFEREAEPRVREALRRFAADAADSAADATGEGYTRRLFADDAERGFALLDLLLSRRYSVVLMNPPFGEPSIPSKPYIEKTYPRTKNDVYAAFVERGLQLLHHGGRLGAITSRTGFFLTSFQKWREEVLLGETRPVALADLGYGVLDTAMVETAAYVLEKTSG